jgi:hypothetical protein
LDNKERGDHETTRDKEAEDPREHTRRVSDMTVLINDSGWLDSFLQVERLVKVNQERERERDQ